MINILWDASHLWGYLLLHAARSAGLPHRLLKGSDIAQAGLSGKVLVVPGGSARHKAAGLGPSGQGAVRRFVAGGGNYLGICGGAGLALAEGLGLCPWDRADMPDKLQHLVSGHVACTVKAGHPLVPAGLEKASLPVWWPARFEESKEGAGADVQVLARYQAPDEDLYVGDLPFSMLPVAVRTEWSVLYGVNLRPSLLDNQPCVIAGSYARGGWVLSYSHLETPLEPAEPSEAGMEPESAANRWFFHILRQWLGGTAAYPVVPPYNPCAATVVWDDPVLLEARQGTERLLALAESLGLLFSRRAWLHGWRTGVPGAQFNGLAAAVGAALALEPDDKRLARWRDRAGTFRENFRLFEKGAQSWLLARRLADMLNDSLPGVLPKALLVDQKETLFGAPMSGGGLCGQLQRDLEDLLF